MGFNITTDNIQTFGRLGSQNRQVRGSTGVSDSLITNDSGFKRLRKAGLVSEATRSTTDTELALEILNVIGCSLSNEPINMSLLTDQTDTEVIQNENIIDEQALMTTVNKKTTAEDKFTNEEDPFYTLDSSVERTISAQRESIKTPTSLQIIEVVTSDVIKTNFDSSSSTLKQFSF